MNTFNQCPLCASDAIQDYCQVLGCRIAKEEMFDYLQCKECNTVFLSSKTPPPKDIYTQEYFESGNRKKLFYRFAGNLWIWFCYSLRFLRAPHFSKNAKILDIGFGAGDWLKFLQKRGFTIYGLDPSEAACAAAQRQGLQNIEKGTLENHNLSEEDFDVVTAIHCLEHDADPKLFLQNIIKLLKPGGWFGMVIPNILSWEACRARGHWYHLDPPYHLCLPTPMMMVKTMLNIGFIDVRMNYPVLEYGQSLLYAVLRRSRIPWILLLPAMPFIIMSNAWFAARQQAGIIEFWGRRPPSSRKEKAGSF